VISYIGFATQTITVGASNTINVVLVEGGTTLDVVEVVSTGYDRTRTAKTTTSAITTVSIKQLENRPNASFLNSLQGTAPGLTILSGSGQPGSAKIDVFIRGVSSINAATEPLIVIDGIPTNGNQFRNLNQNDFETVSVLRDAAATSIYGNRGANGVLVITTKRAKYGSALDITYDVVSGFSQLPEQNYNMANAKQLLTIEQRKNTGMGGGMSDEEIAAYNGPDTNWRDVFFRTGVTQQHNLGMSFGGANTSNFTSIGYFTQTGMVPQTDFQRFTIRNNFNGKSTNDKFNYSSQVSLGYSRRNQLNEETSNAVVNNTIQNPLLGSLAALPYIAPNTFTNGADLLEAIGTDFNGPNDTFVLEDILRGTMPNQFTETNILANISASYKITDELTLGNKSGVDYKDSNRSFARAPQGYLALVVAANRNETFGGFELLNSTKDFTFTNIVNLNYSKLFNDAHRVEAGVYMEYMKSHFIFSGRTQNGLNPKTWTLGSGTGYEAPILETNSYIPTVQAQEINAGTLSYFATLDYDFKERFGFSGVVRRDASYRFTEDNRWGTFWSVSGRWNIDQEEFMQNSGFDMLKLRASYGTQGNQNVVAPAFGTNPLFPGSNLIRDTNVTTTAGNPGYDNVAGFDTGVIANPTLLWEEISQANIGIDFRLAKGRLEGNIDVYQKDTDRLYTQIRRSASTGFYSQAGNNGRLRNSGVEMLLRYKLVDSNDFDLSVFANGSYNRGEVLEIDIPNQDGEARLTLPGQMLFEWNMIPYAGVNQANGNLLFLDQAGNVTETPDPTQDRRPTGKSNIPQFQGGFGLNASYKGFYTDVLFSWAADVWRLDISNFWAYQLDFIGDDNVSADLLNSWTAANPTNMPSLDAANQNFSTQSDRFLNDASFLRLRNLSVGYSFPQKYLEKTFMNSVKLFVQGENLALWTNWRGWDPEQFNATQSTYPNPRTISVGLSVSF
jgi:TonB-linked SusC/RagA family outer membrane protein